MTIREAINKACEGNYFIAKDDYTKSYNKANDHFFYDYVVKGCEEVNKISNVSIHCQSSADKFYSSNEPCSSLYFVTICTSNTHKEFVIRLTAKKKGEGWNIQVTNSDGILDCADLNNFVSIARISELQDEIDALQDEIDAIRASM